MPQPTFALNCRALLGGDFLAAAEKARDFLRSRTTGELLEQVGRTIPGLGLPQPAADKRRFPASYGGGKPCGDDLLAGEGVFYITEAGKLMLDATGGHYQMTWGYNPPVLMALAEEGLSRGVVWDNHSNIPSLPVKLLAEELAALSGDSGPDRAMLGLCTGSVACGAALKVMLARYLADPGRKRLGAPVVMALAGNYHGTDMVAQTLRGMWPGLIGGMEAVQIEPNDIPALEAAFARYGGRVAGFWFEPIMMNREAIALDSAYLRRVRELCDEADALVAVDEIQTCFWCPEMLMFRRAFPRPDLVVVGKGMTAGFHPLSALLFRSDLDILEQYDAISTNGNASLAALVALGNVRMIRREAARVGALGEQVHSGFVRLAEGFPDLLQGVNGDGLLTGMKFRDREDALGFHKTVVEGGLWVRAHAYHPGHRTVLTKFALCAGGEVVDFLIQRFGEALKGRAWR